MLNYRMLRIIEKSLITKTRIKKTKIIHYIEKKGNQKKAPPLKECCPASCGLAGGRLVGGGVLQRGTEGRHLTSF